MDKQTDIQTRGQHAPREKGRDRLTNRQTYRPGGSMTNRQTYRRGGSMKQMYTDVYVHVSFTFCGYSWPSKPMSSPLETGLTGDATKLHTPTIPCWHNSDIVVLRTWPTSCTGTILT